MMNKKVDGRFDWLAFIGRVVGVIVLATLWLSESVRKHNRTGAIAAVGIGYAILPAVAYLHTRYYNSISVVGILRAVRVRIAGHKHGA